MTVDLPEDAVSVEARGKASGWCVVVIRKGGEEKEYGPLDMMRAVNGAEKLNRVLRRRRHVR